MAKGLSKRAYARHRGCSEKAVRKAVESGRITIGEDGLIDPAKADAEWEANTGGRSQGTRSKAGSGRNGKSRGGTAEPKAHPVSQEAVQSVLDTLAEAGEDLGEFDGSVFAQLSQPGVTLNQAQVAKTIVEAHLKRLQVLEMRKKLVEREKAEAFAYDLARQQRDAWLAWPARIAAQFAADLQGIEDLDQRGVHALLEQYVQEHLTEIGELQPKQLA